MIAPRGVAKLRTLIKVTIFPQPVPDPFISDHCLICEIFKPIKSGLFWEEKFSINILPAPIYFYIDSNILNFYEHKVLQNILGISKINKIYFMQNVFHGHRKFANHRYSNN